MPFLPDTARRVYYRRWDAEAPKANIVFFHGVGEYSGLYHRFAHAMNHAGYSVWALDHIGHGSSEGSPSECYNLSALLENSRHFVEFVRREGGKLPLVIAAHSMGGVMTTLLMSQPDHPKADAVIFIGTPLAHVDLPENLLEIETAVDVHFQENYDNDTQLLPPDVIDFAALEKGFDQVQAFVQPRLASWDFPALFLCGEHDPFAPSAMVREWSRKIPDARFNEIKGGHHGLLEDWCNGVVTNLMCSFIYEVITDCVIR